MTVLAALVGGITGCLIGAVLAGPAGAIVGGFVGAIATLSAVMVAVAITTPPEWDGDPFDEPDWQNPVQR